MQKLIRDFHSLSPSWHSVSQVHLMGYSQIVDMDVYGDGEEGGEDDMTEEEFRAMLAEVYYWPMFFILF